MNKIKSAAWIAAAATLVAPGIVHATAPQKPPVEKPAYDPTQDLTRVLVKHGDKAYVFTVADIHDAYSQSSKKAAVEAELFPNDHKHNPYDQGAVSGAFEIVDCPEGTKPADFVLSIKSKYAERALIIAENALLTKGTKGYVAAASAVLLSFLAGLGLAVATRPCAKDKSTNEAASDVENHQE